MYSAVQKYYVQKLYSKICSLCSLLLEEQQTSNNGWLIQAEKIKWKHILNLWVAEVMNDWSYYSDF